MWYNYIVSRSILHNLHTYIYIHTYNVVQTYLGLYMFGLCKTGVDTVWVFLKIWAAHFTIGFPIKHGKQLGWFGDLPLWETPCRFTRKLQQTYCMYLPLKMMVSVQTIDNSIIALQNYATIQLFQTMHLLTSLVFAGGRKSTVLVLWKKRSLYWW